MKSIGAGSASRPAEEEDIPQRILDFLERHRLLVEGKPLVVGVSGGADSVCLLQVLTTLRDRLGIQLHVAHVNHCLRGEDSDADAAYVSQLSADLGFPCTVVKRDVAAYRSEHRLSLEEAARELRYRFFSEVALALGTDRLAVGHTQDDWVETILMHLIRGTGPWGLQGLQPVSRWTPSKGYPLTVIRPLLGLTRSETEEYCRQHGLVPRRDPSNLSRRFLRNRVRHDLIPWFQGCNPNFSRGLVSTAEILAEEQDFLLKELSEVWDKAVAERDNRFYLTTEVVLSLHPALQYCLLREVFRRLLGDVKDIEKKHFEKVRDALSWPSGRRVTLPRGLIFYVEYGECVVGVGSSCDTGLSLLDQEWRLQVPGQTQLPGWRVEARIEEGAKHEEFQRDPPGSVNTAYLDFGVSGDEIIVRGRKPGDRFQPLGMSQPKKLQDFMVDVHIARALRDRVPLVCSSSQIIWVVGWHIDERAKVRESTEKILCLRFERLDSHERRGS